MQKKRYGVWGLGIVGMSVLRYLHKQGHSLSVMDKRLLSSEEKVFLDAHEVLFIPQGDQKRFFDYNDYLIVSPGIARPPELPQEKLIEELDFFCDAWQKQLIAVTGSIGKTSTVELLSQIMNHYGYPVAAGGNVGTGMLDLLDLQEIYTYALIELSSFQLEHSKHCAPDLALWLNFYPNHLDRHNTLERYFLAKYAIIKHQTATQKALVPLALKDQLRNNTDRPFHFFSSHPFSDAHLASLMEADIFYGKKGDEIVKIQATKEEVLMPVEALPRLSFEENWLAIVAALDILLQKKEFSLSSFEITIPEHRLEKVTTINGIAFYNDSKSSIFEATQAAVESLQPQRIHLLLGGISKGIDRASLLPKLQGKVASIHCFGNEAAELYQGAVKANIPATAYRSLEEACTMSFKQARSNDTILLSPAGASFDLFSDYKERGKAFKKIIETKLSTLSS